MEKPFANKPIIILSAIFIISLFISNYIALILFAILFFLLYKNQKFTDNQLNIKITEATQLQTEISQLQDKLNKLDTEKLQKEILILKEKMDETKKNYQEQITSYDKILLNKNSELENINQEIQNLTNSQVEILEKEKNKIKRIRELYKSMRYTINNFSDNSALLSNEQAFDEFDSMNPSAILKLHNMDVKDLRKAFRENDKQITKVLDQYSSRYTTKSNRAIYSLMVIALRSELQNILTKLKYDKLDDGIKEIKELSQKYLHIAGEGNQTIVNTLTKFIGQIEYLFINAAKIEYNYYVKKEKERQEQLALREKMREEAAERKALEAEKKKIEEEEAKYETEIQKIKLQIENAAEEEKNLLNQRILELQTQLSDVMIKKNDIVNLQNGKAGTVYVISNLGSFGDNVFKIGMTRRIDPQDRVNELGSASVPFKFDVHSFIFSEDAVSLENKMHEMLNDKRVNKVNLRKEFFQVSLDELEELVQEIDPTAEFNKTMVASEYRASIDADEDYSTEENLSFDFD